MSSIPNSAPPTRRPVYPSDLARSERRRKQKAGQRQRARASGDGRQLLLDLAEELEKSAGRPKYAELVEAVARVNSLALSLRTRGNSTPDRDADAILYAVSKPSIGAHLVEEIAEDTGLTKPEVKKVLSGMLATGLVEKVETPRGDEYWPTGKRLGDVLP